MGVNPRHLYIHVPFCVRRCGYCDFAVTPTRAAPLDEWLDAIAAELRFREAAGAWSGPMALDTLYVGGGTPSLLGTGAMARLAAVLAPFARWDAGLEWTVEANPESFTPELARDWAAAGVNRVSLGAQTFHEPSLQWMGRLHGAEGPARALDAARAAGLDNVSVDLIFGLPERLGRDWGHDLDRALALEPAHISLYGLTAEMGTPLGRWVGEGREKLVGEDGYAEQYLLAATRLTAAGMNHYEVSNFARPGRESRHNRAYWRHASYVGLGPGAHSFLPPVRMWNVRDWAEYRHRLAEGDGVEADREVLGRGDVALEATWLGLRSSDGLPLAQLSTSQQLLVADWVAGGLAGAADDRVSLTHAGWLVLDRLAVELDSRSG